MICHLCRLWACARSYLSLNDSKMCERFCGPKFKAGKGNLTICSKKWTIKDFKVILRSLSSQISKKLRKFSIQMSERLETRLIQAFYRFLNKKWMETLTRWTLKTSCNLENCFLCLKTGFEDNNWIRM